MTKTPSRSLVESIKRPVWNGSCGSPRAIGHGPSMGMGMGHGMMTRGRTNGGGRNSHTLARGAQSERRGWAHLHVKLGGKFQCSKLLNLLLQPSIFLRQILAAPFQYFAVHLGLLQLSPEINFNKIKLQNKHYIKSNYFIFVTLYFVTNLALLFWNHTSTCLARRPSCFASANFCFCKQHNNIFTHKTKNKLIEQYNVPLHPCE